MKQKISTLEAEVKNKTQEAEEAQCGLKEEVRTLTAQCQNSERQVRELNAKISALQARSPEVWIF